MDVEIKEWSNTHAYVTVIERGKQWHTTWAKELNEDGQMISPTVQQVKQAFQENKRNFDPYTPCL